MEDWTKNRRRARARTDQGSDRTTLQDCELSAVSASSLNVSGLSNRDGDQSRDWSITSC